MAEFSDESTFQLEYVELGLERVTTNRRRATLAVTIFLSIAAFTC
jgi:hypothetical protein